MYKKHYGEQSLKYKEEMKKRETLYNEEKAMQQAMDREAADTAGKLADITAAQVRNRIRAATADRASFPSLLTLLGGQDQADQVREQLDELAAAYEEDMRRIRIAQQSAQNPAETQAALDKMRIAQAKYAADVENIQLRAAEQTKRAWENVVTGIGDAFNRGVTGMLLGTTTFQKSYLSMLDAILTRAIDIPLKMAENWIAGEIAKWVGVESADAAGRAAQVATALMQIETDAAVAAAGAFAAEAGVPIVGPALATGAAAAAYAEVMSFAAPLAAFETGSYNIPDNMVAALHRGEMVIPAGIAQGIRASSAESAGGFPAGGGGANVIINSNPSVHALDSSGMTNVLRTYATTLARSVVQELNRNPNLMRQLPGTRS
jgi:hypothetical protein